MNTEDDPISELETFMEDLPTIRCGERGCDSCDAAFRRCMDTRVTHDRDSTPGWDEGDTYPALPELLWDELGGEG